MKVIRVVACIAALALPLLAGCGSSPPARHPTAGHSCANAGSVKPSNPVVQLKTTSQGLHTISHATTVGCSDWVKVLGTNSAANLRFSAKDLCQLGLIGPGAPPSLVQIREPEGALFRLAPGEVQCSFLQPAAIPMCGQGTVYPSGHTSGLIACGDPLFKVAVYYGTMRVKIHSRACFLTADTLLSYNFATGQAVPKTAAPFTKAQLQLFARQAEELGMAIGPRSSSTQPSCEPG
jgi:hypothetical protein